MQLDAGAVTLPFRTTANSVCCVVEGAGESQIGSDTIRWRRPDIFTLPQGKRIVHKSSGARVACSRFPIAISMLGSGFSGKSTGISWADGLWRMRRTWNLSREGMLPANGR